MNVLGTRSADEAHSDDDSERTDVSNGDGSPEGGRSGGPWDAGLSTLLVFVGVILFVHPEPATSGIGLLLAGIGVLSWLVGLVT